MATKPRIYTLTNSSVDILNAIRNSATTDYRNYVPIATADADSIKEIGAIIMDSPNLQNEFINALINRIGRVLITSRTYQNPWSMFKKGVLDFGETIEEIFVDIAEPFQYDPAVAENELYKRVTPNVRSAFHVMNYQKFYKVTVQENDLKKAFLSWDGVVTLITGIIDSMYKAANYDEFMTMKYLLARHILNGHLYPVTVSAPTAENAKSIVSTVKAVSNDFVFLSEDYNIAGVHNESAKDRQYVIIDSKFDAIMDVEVLASAFNMDKAQFAGRRVLIDGFGKLDTTRLGELFKDDPTYEEISEDELKALNAVPAVLVDEDFFMIFDALTQMREAENGQGLYWNYMYHVWKIFSVSPFANSACFVTGVPTVSNVTVSPSSVTDGTSNGSVTLVANVDTEYFAPKSVRWSVTSEPAEGQISVSRSGTVTWTGWTSGSFEITATSIFDSEKYYTVTFMKP